MTRLGVDEAALDRGDRVAATGRSTDALADLLAQHGDAMLSLQLDVADRDAVFQGGDLDANAFGIKVTTVGPTATPPTGAAAAPSQTTPHP